MTPAPTASPTPGPTPTERPAPETVLVGDPVTITVTDAASGERDWTIVTVTEATEQDELPDGRRPSRGNVFLVVTI